MAIDSAIEAGVPLADREPDPAAALPADDHAGRPRGRPTFPHEEDLDARAGHRPAGGRRSGVKTELLRVRTQARRSRRCSRSCTSATPGCSCSGPHLELVARLRFRLTARRVRRDARLPGLGRAGRLTGPSVDTRGAARYKSSVQVCTTRAPTRERTNGGEDVGRRALLGTRLRVGSGLVPDRAPEGAARQADRALRAGDARQREALRRRAALPAPQLRDPRRERLPRAHRARGVRRARREPRGLHDGLRDARPLRLRVDGHVLRHAHGAVATIMLRPTPGADRQVHPPAERLQDRHAVLLGPRDRLALLVPVLLEGRALERRLQGQQEGVLDHVGRVRRLLRRADHQPGLQGLRRPVGVRDRRRAT